MHSQDYDEEEIVRRCQNGDLRAYKMIYQQYNQSLLRVAMRMLGQQQDAEDAVQMAFIKLYGSVKNFQFNSKFSTYFFRILINVCYDLLKKKNRMKLEDIDSINQSHFPDNDLRMQLEEAIAVLPERMRACFVLFAIEELKQTEIAEILSINLGTVKANIYHARIKLQEMLSVD